MATIGRSREFDVPRSIFADIAGLDVQARKNVLRALREAREREEQLEAEVDRLRALLLQREGRARPSLLARLRERLRGSGQEVA